MLISNFPNPDIGFENPDIDFYIGTSAVGLLIGHSRSIWCVGATVQGVMGKGTDEMDWQRGGTERN